MSNPAVHSLTAFLGDLEVVENITYGAVSMCVVPAWAMRWQEQYHSENLQAIRHAFKYCTSVATVISRPTSIQLVSMPDQWPSTSHDWMSIYHEYATHVATIFNREIDAITTNFPTLDMYTIQLSLHAHEIVTAFDSMANFLDQTTMMMTSGPKQE